MKRLINFIKKLFKKKLKPKHYEEKEIVAGGYVSAGDFLCVKKQNDPISKN
jgi:hypothetical protein